MRPWAVSRTTPKGFFAEVALAEAKDWQKRRYYRLGWNGAYGDRPFALSVSENTYDLTGTDFRGQVGTGARQRHALSRLSFSSGAEVGLEYLATEASSWVGVAEFIPRMSAPFANSQGRLDYWWDAVSDFNKDGETAWKLRVLSPKWDLWQLDWQLGADLLAASGVSGWNSAGQKTDQGGYERGFNLDATVSVPRGPSQEIFLRAHYTHLDASGDNLDPTQPRALFDRYGLFTLRDTKIMLVYKWVTTD